jgi:hypothetical protein
MKALVLVSLAVLFLASGCSSPTFYWYQPDRTLDEAKAEYTECQDEARQKAGDVINDQHYDRLPPPDGPSALQSSPRDPGRSATDPRDTQDAWRQRYEQSVVADGMKAKGYMKLRPDRIPRGVHTKKFSQGAVAGR